MRYKKGFRFKTTFPSEKEPLTWMEHLNPTARIDVISWFNSKMDELVTKQRLLQYNNPNNSLTDIINEITKMAKVYVAPDEYSSPKEIEYFVSITEDGDDILNLTYQYCLKHFDKVK